MEAITHVARLRTKTRIGWRSILQNYLFQTMAKLFFLTKIRVLWQSLVTVINYQPIPNPVIIHIFSTQMFYLKGEMSNFR